MLDLAQGIVALPNRLITGIEASCWAILLSMENSLLWRTLGHFRRAVGRSVSHDVFTTAKAAAYSAILSLFPALLVLNTLLALTPETGTVTRRVARDSRPGAALGHDGVCTELLSQQPRPFHARDLVGVVGGFLLRQWASCCRSWKDFAGPIAVPRHVWGFWRSRAIAVALIPICLAPMFCATALIVFGHQIEIWMIDNSDHELRFIVLVFWRMLRWAISIVTVVAVITVIYHFGTPRTHSWKCALPGAAMATRDLVRGHVALWLVCHSIRHLYGGLRIVGGGHSDPGLAVYHFSQHADWGGV